MTFPCRFFVPLPAQEKSHTLQKIIIDTTKNSPISQTLNEVTVSSRTIDKNVRSSSTGTIELSKNEVSGLPSLLGETDFYKTMQLMPGFQKSGEGNAAIYVRGGGYDQNLIMLDEATVYNPTHLLGFYSVFNTDIIGDATLIKSGMPAEYGNRISSVLKFNTKRSIPERTMNSGSLGLISSKWYSEIPVLGQKGGLFLAGRKTYLNEVLQGLRHVGIMKVQRSALLNSIGYDFYDLNVSLVLALSSKNRLTASIYRGNDAFSMSNDDIGMTTDMSWGNLVSSLTWSHLFNNKTYIDNSFIYSGYNFNMHLNQDQSRFTLNSQIKDIGFKSKITRIFDKHNLRGGTELIRHNVQPNSGEAASDTTPLYLGSTSRYYSYELSFYLSDEYEITPKLSLTAGTRYNLYYQVGPFTEYVRSSESIITDTLHYKNGALVKNYSGLDVRLSMRYLISEKSSVKASFNTNNQYMNLVNISSVAFPSDFWVPSSKYVKPQFGEQYTLGFYRSFPKLKLEGSVEMYYKSFRNQMEFTKGIFSSVTNSPLDENLIFGKGRAYGLEVLIRKSVGHFTGWVGYTFSRTEKSFNDIENGHWYPAKYDRPHDISLVGNYTLNSRWSFSGVFVYTSGSTYTPVVGRYLVANNVVSQYGAFNSARMPDYHRLDISTSYTFKPKRFYSSKLNLSVYNVYNRKNPFFIYPATTGSLKKYSITVSRHEVSIFSIIPSLSWQFSF
ncbi:MAG: TonB-dependent receptor plug domain-containing protein [Bacteroidota bacterium]|nr:TonB-dependent receptor plug domain-containing protein [Bacteroidota bacterium]